MLTVRQSLFDMSMFEWPLAPGAIVSDRFWVYWAVTLPLTLVIIGIWLLWTNRKELREWYQNAAALPRAVEKDASAV